MRPPLFIQPFQFIEAHSAKQTTRRNMHKFFFLPFGKLLWTFSKFLNTNEKKHDFNIGKFHLEVARNKTLQLSPFFINLGCFHAIKSRELFTQFTNKFTTTFFNHMV